MSRRAWRDGPLTALWIVLTQRDAEADARQRYATLLARTR